MRIEEFVNKYNGRYLESDGSYLYQCVDLTKQWQKENGWSVTNGNAAQWPQNADKRQYEWIPNGIHNKPNPGDIVVFGGNRPYGHIGVCISANYIDLTCFEQNRPLRSPCHPVFIKRYGLGTSQPVRGWLRKR